MNQKSRDIKNRIPYYILFGFLGIFFLILFGWKWLPHSQVNIETDDNWISESGEILNWKDSENFTVFYAGFIGCSEKCPIALYKMNHLTKNNPQYKSVFLIIDPLMDWNDIRKYIGNFEYIDVYRSTSKNPHNQLRNLKFQMGIDDPTNHSDHFLVVPPKKSNLSPIILRDLTELDSPIADYY